MIKNTVKKGDMTIKITPEEFIKNADQYELGSFEDFVMSGSYFFSYSVQEKIPEFVEKFKKLGLDVSEVEPLQYKMKEYSDLNTEYEEISINTDYENGSKEEEDRKQELLEMMDGLLPDVEKLETEIILLAKTAKSLI